MSNDFLISYLESQIDSFKIEQSILIGPEFSNNIIKLNNKVNILEDRAFFMDSLYFSLVTDMVIIENQISSRYEINDRNAEIIVEVVLGPISGSYTANITGSPKVSDHTRSYEDTRPWEFPDGHWETVNHIPPDIAIDKGWEALG